MRKTIINLFAVIFILTLFVGDALAKHNIKMIADVQTDFTAKSTELPNEITFKTTESRTIPNVISIPAGSLVTLEVLKAQRELRWHKSGQILCKIKSFTPEGSVMPIDISDKNIHLTVKKHEEINKKEAWILGTEIVVMQGASFFAPGVDIAYFFTKGAIQRQKHPNWFKAGVRNAYDNSIFWFPQKGKPIELEEGHQVQIKDISPEKVEKLAKSIDKRNARFERQAAHRIAKLDKKILKRALKNEEKSVNVSVVESAIENEIIEKNVHAELANIKDIDGIKQ